MRQIFRRRLSKKQAWVFVRFVGVLTEIALLLYMILYLGFSSLTAAAIIAVLGILLVFIGGYHYDWAWTGFGAYTHPKVENQEFQREKTLWDWMQLLIIPAVIAGGALLFNAWNTRTEHETVADNQREAALEAYFDKMSELLLDKDLRTRYDAEICSIARTRTLTVLRKLDGERKGMLLQFLGDSLLIKMDTPIISLEDADLVDAHLSGANLNYVNLSGAHMSYANLSGADLKYANLRGSDLRGSNMSKALLSSADLRDAKLGSAFLSEANLWSADMLGADLHKSDLRGAFLRNANLRTADLSGADLSGADLSGAVVSAEQLASAKSLQGTILPDGSKHD